MLRRAEWLEGCRRDLEALTGQPVPRPALRDGGERDRARESAAETAAVFEALTAGLPEEDDGLDAELPQRVHEALVRKTHGDQLVGHLSRDSTAIEAREKPAVKEKAPTPPKRKRGRPKKGEERPKRRTRLERQSTMTLPEMLDDLPTDCDVGTKKNSKGYRDTWVGYKLHIAFPCGRGGCWRIC